MILRAIQLEALPGISSLLGTTGNKSVMDTINSQFGNGSFFNSESDIFKERRSIFMKNFVEPIRAVESSLKILSNKLHIPKEDKIISLTSDDAFIDVPPCMYLPILLYDPVINLFKQGRVFGFGYNYDFLKDQEDVYGRLINNGRVEDIASKIDKDGWVEFKSIYKSTDPLLSENDIDFIEETRKYVNKLIEKKIDPTDAPNSIG